MTDPLDIHKGRLEEFLDWKVPAPRAERREHSQWQPAGRLTKKVARDHICSNNERKSILVPAIYRRAISIVSEMNHANS